MWTTISDVDVPFLLNLIFWFSALAFLVSALKLCATCASGMLIASPKAHGIALVCFIFLVCVAATCRYIKNEEREEIRNRIKTSVEGNLVFELRDTRPVTKDGRIFLNIRTSYGQEFSVLASPNSGEEDQVRRIASLPPGTLLAIPWENASKEVLEELPARVVIERSTEGNLVLRIK